MVREAISASPNLKSKTTETFGQGSYANNTNVKLNSDIDINVMYSDGMFYELPAGASSKDYGITPHSYTFTEYKKDIYDALVSKFGVNDVQWNDKCITIRGNTYRVETDVVPTWLHTRYESPNSTVEGCKFFSDNGKGILNYPKQHIQNGINKSNQTHRRFKKLTRIHRKLRYQLIDEGVIAKDPISSFLLECLVFNCPNDTFNKTSWNDRLKSSITFLYLSTDDAPKSNEWGEVSELLYLFKGRKWTQSDVKHYMGILWTYLEY